MTPTSEELRLGWKAYRGVCAYENYGRRKRYQFPVIAAGCFLFLAALSFYSHDRSHEFAFLSFYFMALSWGFWAQYRREKDAYAERQLLLRFLKEKYGDELPWIVEEKTLAQARELELATAKDKVQPTHA